MWQPTGISSNEISHIVKVTTSLSHNVITPLITQILDFAKCSECGFIGKCICNGCDFCDNQEEFPSSQMDPNFRAMCQCGMAMCMSPEFSGQFAQYDSKNGEPGLVACESWMSGDQ